MGAISKEAIQDIKNKDKDMNLDNSKDNTQRHNASFQYFENRDCKYYPCHNIEASGFNCLFCYCPVYFAICPGTPQYIEINGVTFKSCADCKYPHIQENYQAIIDFCSAMLKGGQSE